jgi:hypothetical protein
MSVWVQVPPGAKEKLKKLGKERIEFSDLSFAKVALRGSQEAFSTMNRTRMGGFNQMKPMEKLDIKAAQQVKGINELIKQSKLSKDQKKTCLAFDLAFLQNSINRFPIQNP